MRAFFASLSEAEKEDGQLATLPEFDGSNFLNVVRSQFAIFHLLS